MKLTSCVSIIGLLSTAVLAQSPNSGGNGNGNGPGGADGIIIVPDSSLENPSDIGRKSHTNHLVFLRGQRQQTYLAGLTPSDIQTAYNLSSLSGAGVIAIVDAYHYPGAFSDLTTFSSAYTPGNVLGLCGTGGPSAKKPCFWQVYADSNGSLTNTQPAVNCGWNQEAALDIEWAHAMAPNASIVLVEAQSNYNSDLFGAVKAGADIADLAGGGMVSMSWGSSEYPGETTFDSLFQNRPAVAFIASTGDSGGKVIYPSASPWVIAAGGTTLNMTGTAGSATFASETGWSGSGGGSSKYESALSYQNGIANIIGPARGVPDFSFDADPSTGVRVFGPTCNANATGWMIFGGTSVSAPSLAGIINSARVGAFGSSVDELTRIYDLTSGEYRDIISGRAGKFSATAGWDFVTGMGTPITLAGK